MTSNHLILFRPHLLLPSIFPSISIGWKVTDTLTLALVRDLGEVSSFSAWLQSTSIFYPFFNQQKLPQQKTGVRHKGKATRQSRKYLRSQGEQVSKPRKEFQRSHLKETMDYVFCKQCSQWKNSRWAISLYSLLPVSAAQPFSSYTIHVFNFTHVWKCRGKAHNLYGSPNSC